MTLNDGYEMWRKQEFNDLENLVQSKFYGVMNPDDCNNAKYLRCTGEHGCGWGEFFEKNCQFLIIKSLRLSD
jgi:hypothetical protein